MSPRDGLMSPRNGVIPLRGTTLADMAVPGSKDFARKGKDSAIFWAISAF
jgi:hypothetical protein